MRRAKLLYLLRIVWEIGPAPNREIAREAGLYPKVCYPILYQLEQDGYIEHRRREQYDITERGRGVLTSEKKQSQGKLFS